jgi:hypothetical protein
MTIFAKKFFAKLQQPRQDSQERTARTGQPEQDNYSRTDNYPGLDNKDVNLSFFANSGN